MIDVSAFAKTLNGKPVAVFGMGVSNRAVVRALHAAGVRTVSDDDDPEKREKSLLAEDLTSYACLVVAPGVKLSHPVLARAREAGLEILCDIEILHRCGYGRKVIGVTGTNGKSTTTALIGHILNQCGVPAAVGGNIGRAVLDLDLPPVGGCFVLELSSYQLDLCPAFAPDVAVLLNITPDHLDHHETIGSYIAAKKKIFRGPGDAVIAVDDETCRRIFDDVSKAGKRKMYPVSCRDEVPENIQSLPGMHNRQNMAAALSVAELMGVGRGEACRAMEEFPGLPHRQQIVAEMGGVAWVNDSKATNAAAAARALSCYRNIYWIVGGRPKEGGLTGLESLMDRVRHAFLIGESQDSFSRWMNIYGVPHSLCGSLEKAVAAASAMAENAHMGMVLLSPACASFDQFKNFEHRGEAFIAMVKKYTGTKS